MYVRNYARFDVSGRIRTQCIHLATHRKLIICVPRAIYLWENTIWSISFTLPFNFLNFCHALCLFFVAQTYSPFLFEERQSNLTNNDFVHNMEHSLIYVALWLFSIWWAAQMPELFALSCSSRTDMKILTQYFLRSHHHSTAAHWQSKHNRQECWKMYGRN